MAMATIVGKVGGKRLLLLAIVGALVSSIIAFSMAGTASADHECPPLPHTEQDCDDLLVAATAEAEQVAQTDYDDCTALYPPFLWAIICDPALVQDLADIAAHTGESFPPIYDRLVQEHIDTHVHEVSKKVVVCHQTGSKKNPQKTIEISRNALNAHLAHGDTEGPC